VQGHCEYTNSPLSSVIGSSFDELAATDCLAAFEELAALSFLPAEYLGIAFGDLEVWGAWAAGLLDMATCKVKGRHLPRILQARDIITYVNTVTDAAHTSLQSRTYVSMWHGRISPQCRVGASSTLQSYSHNTTGKRHPYLIHLREQCRSTQPS
jgi:hypothetical protein